MYKDGHPCDHVKCIIYSLSNVTHLESRDKLREKSQLTREIAEVK